VAKTTLEDETLAPTRETIVKKGLVSIVIPTLNRPESLKRTLEAVFRQSYRDFEVIVVDDGSDYDVEEAIKDYPVRKLLRLPHSGSNIARNTGYQHTRGEYLLFCDDDVELDARFLERMVETLRANEDKAYAYCGFDLDGNILAMQPFSGDKLKKGNYINTVSLIRRSRFPGFDPRIRRLQDWDLWLTMLEDGDEGVWVPEVLFRTTIKNTPAISDGSSLVGWTYTHAYEVVLEKHGLSDLAKALQVLLRIYCSRKDLQTAYPESEDGDYSRLIIWAADVVNGRFADGAYSDLSPYGDWYDMVSSHAAKRKSMLESKIAMLESKIAMLESKITVQTSQIATLELHASQLKEKLSKCLVELNEIRQSLGWISILSYRSLLRRYFPDGTLRRAMLDLLVKKILLPCLGGLALATSTRRFRIHAKRFAESS